MYTQENLESDIRQIGVDISDVLTVHTSLRSVGEIDNTEKSGANVLIDALKNCVSDGILMIPAHTYANIRELPVFDIRNTMPCIGALPRVAVELANEAYDNGDKTCVRSMQVSHSVVVFGKNAYEFAECDRATKTRTPPSGCYGNLYRQNGKILLIGVGLHSNTYIHMVDEYLDYDCNGTIPSETQWIHVTDYDGTEWEQERLLTTGPRAQTFERYADALKRSGGMTCGKIGDADAVLINCRKCFDAVTSIRRSEQHS
ncbi:MAG: AAC(3) family N-acetyltransferase [Oscillospiraceae bacterium]|nr:AAC(3) family N-acetyltransferase [Oscillospiraceae bacterium]MBQ6697437.1 AAC(3) family N-acetyltransferase [Oscillospiraceae bacterium]